MTNIPFRIGQIYNRRQDIHDPYGGQQRGGISTPKGAPFIFLFTGETGQQYGYSDGPGEDGVFRYTGEGQIGPMGFIRGNRAILEHSVNGKDLMLFEKLPDASGYRFLGDFACTGYEPGEAPDRNRTIRPVIVFHLVPLSDQQSDDPAASLADDVPNNRSLQELRRRAVEASTQVAAGTGAASVRSYYYRSAAVRAYVLARAKGRCEGCELPAPFERLGGGPYLEPHHTRRVSDGGPDHPRWVAALCPTCHRRIHHGTGGDELNTQIVARLGRIEGEMEDRRSGSIAR